jgi:hypothetical protein
MTVTWPRHAPPLPGHCVLYTPPHFPSTIWIKDLHFGQSYQEILAFFETRMVCLQPILYFQKWFLLKPFIFYQIMHYVHGIYLFWIYKNVPRDDEPNGWYFLLGRIQSQIPFILDGQARILPHIDRIHKHCGLCRYLLHFRYCVWFTRRLCIGYI